MKLKFIPVCISLALFAASSQSIANKDLTTIGPGKQAIDIDPSFYYKIGGAKPIAFPVTQRRELDIGISAELDLSFSCGKFDPDLAFANAFNQFKNGAENTANQMVNAATNSISELPMLLLQRAWPDLANIFQNYKYEIGEKINVTTMTCESMEGIYEENDNPFGGWNQQAKSEAWGSQAEQAQAGNSSSDILTAKENVDEQAGENGVTWVGGKKAGGKDQDPIRVINDVVTAGYNMMQSRDVFDARPAERGSRLSAVFPKPRDAREFASHLLGEVDIRTHGETTSKPGVGFASKVDEEYERILEEMIKIIDSSKEPTLEDINKISTPSVAITYKLIDDIRKLPLAERLITLENFASEIAIASIIDKALLLRRLLLTGSKETNVASSPAATNIKDKLDEIESEIDSIMFEVRIKREMVSTTALKVHEYQSRKQNVQPITIKPGGGDMNGLGTPKSK